MESAAGLQGDRTTQLPVSLLALEQERDALASRLLDTGEVS
jgi:hypothetical protein